MSSPEAVYDTLYIGQKLQRKLEDFSQYEVQFFAYFGCLLSLYNGNSVAEWNYSFVKTKYGSPYSLDLHGAIDTLIANESLKSNVDSNDYFKLSETGQQFLEYMEENAPTLSGRKKFLSAACNSISLIPFSSVKDAIGREPVLHSAGMALAKKSLLVESNPATQVLYTQFRDLKSALEGKYDDLLVPAVVWLESLNPTTNESKLA